MTIAATMTGYDSERRPLDGNNKYVMHFEKDGTPPTNAFWSLVLYDSARRLSKNRLERSSLGSLDALIQNKDGSIDLLHPIVPALGGQRGQLVTGTDGRVHTILEHILP